MSKRVLFVTGEIVPFHYGGIGTLFKAVAKALRRRGYETALLGREPAGFDIGLFRRHYGDVPFFAYRPAAVQGEQGVLASAQGARKAFRSLLPSFHPDVVIGADFGGECLHLLCDACAGVYGNTTFVLTINGMTRDVTAVYEGGEEAFWNRWLWDSCLRRVNAAEELTVRLADRVVAPTAWVWDQVRERTGIEREVTVIPNLSDEDLFGGPAEAGAVVPSEGVILFVGRLDRMKGTDILLDAYLRLAVRTPAHLPKLVLVGRDCFWREYGTTFRAHWQPRIPAFLKERVVFTGQIRHEEVREYLKRAVLCVFPSRWEPFGIVCLEAMKAGRPVLVSGDTGLAEVVGPAFPECLVDVHAGPEALAEALRRFLDALPSRPDLGTQVRMRAMQIHREAEQGWVALLEGCDGRNRKRDSLAVPADFFTNIVEAWSPDADPPEDPPAARLKVYLRKDGTYSEDRAVHVDYPAFRWTTLRIALPAGTGEAPLRLDPAEEAGRVHIARVSVSQGGKEIWRCQGTELRRLAVGGGVGKSIQGDWLELQATSSDPQVLLDCPEIKEPAVLDVFLCCSPGPPAA